MQTGETEAAFATYAWSSSIPAEGQPTPEPSNALARWPRAAGPQSRPKPLACMVVGAGASQHPLDAGPCMCAGRDTKMLIWHSGPLSGPSRAVQQCNGLWSLLPAPARKVQRGISVVCSWWNLCLLPISRKTNFVCAQARGICPLSHFCLYHLNIQSAFVLQSLWKTLRTSWCSRSDVPHQTPPPCKLIRVGHGEMEAPQSPVTTGNIGSQALITWNAANTAPQNTQALIWWGETPFLHAV